MTINTGAQIVYFEQEGRENLQDVLRVMRKALKKREGLRSKKIVIFTAYGEGPLLAYNLLNDLDPKIIAVTFPPDFYFVRNNERVFPAIPEKLQKFFAGVEIPIITTRLPFDKIKGADAQNANLDLIVRVLRILGGGLSQCVQATLQACDAGKICPGEQVIAITGDYAVLITASNTTSFLEGEGGMEINEIFCKPRTYTISRKRPAPATIAVQQQPTLVEPAKVKQLTSTLEKE